MTLTMSKIVLKYLNISRIYHKLNISVFYEVQYLEIPFYLRLSTLSRILSIMLLLMDFSSYGTTAQSLYPSLLRFLNHTQLDTAGLLLTSDQPVSEASTYRGQHNIWTRDNHPYPQRDSNPATKRPQTYALNSVATGIGCCQWIYVQNIFIPQPSHSTETDRYDHIDFRH
jgi:hypothetical protein